MQALVAGAVLLLIVTLVLSGRAWVLTSQRHDLRQQRSDLEAQLTAGLDREKSLNRQLDDAHTQIDQLSGSGDKKEQTIKQLQDQVASLQGQLADITSQRDVLRDCLNGMTTALLQLSNGGTSAANDTINGVRDTCAKANVII